MLLDANLSPLSQSILLPAARQAHGRLLRSLSLDAARPLPPPAPGWIWDQQPLAEAICAAWGHTAERVADLLQVDPARIGNRSKGGKGEAAATTALAAAPAARQGMMVWSESVAAMKWSQAQLLQIMEEVEPQITAGLWAVESLACAAAGSYLSLHEQLERRLGDQAAGVLLDLVSGLDTPPAAFVVAVASGAEHSALAARFGHLADSAFELANPRLHELSFLPVMAAGPSTWQQAAARERQQQAMATALAAAGWLGRSSMSKSIERTQVLMTTYAEVYDALLHALAAVRRWVLAAAHEAARGGRLAQSDEIFLLELEEIKQILTGEWHSAGQVQPIIQQRREGRARQGEHVAGARRLTGVAGRVMEGEARCLRAPVEAAAFPAGGINWLPDSELTWAGALLRSAGVALAAGDWLSPLALAARSGGIPAVLATWPEASAVTGVWRLDPGANTLTPVL